MQPENQIPYELREKVDRELESGEQIQWLQMPVPHCFTPEAREGLLFGIPWTAFAIFWTVGTAWKTFNAGDAYFSWVFPLFGIPFVWAGFGILSAPIRAYRNALKTVYVITNRRAITFYGGQPTAIRSYLPEQLTDVYRQEKRDGTGDVIISRRTLGDSIGGYQYEYLGFLSVRDPKAVEAMLKQLAEQAEPRQVGCIPCTTCTAASMQEAWK